MRSEASRRRAFTLAELMVVVAILGVLAGITIPAVMRVRDNANRLACKNNMKQIGIALANYEAGNGRLPAGSSSPSLASAGKALRTGVRDTPRRSAIVASASGVGWMMLK